MWWNESEAALQERLKGLVQKGQLQLVGALPYETEEGIADYKDIVHLVIQTQKFLKDQIGTSSHIGWNMQSNGNSLA